MQKKGPNYKDLKIYFRFIICALCAIGDQKYIKFGETGYHLIQQDGKSMYEVVTVEKDYVAILNGRIRI